MLPYVFRRLLQAIPAMVMLYAMVKGVLAPADTTAVLPKA